MTTPSLARRHSWPAPAVTPQAQDRGASPARPGVIDVSLPPQRHAGWRAVLAWLEASVLVEAAGLLIVLFGMIVVGAISLMGGALRWIADAVIR